MSAVERRSLKQEHAEATRAELASSARTLFAEHGFAGVSTEQVVRRAGVTRGALYHHFADKQDLFRAVVRDVEDDVLDRTMAAVVAEPRPERHLEAGCVAFLDACLDPAVRRIMLIDAPSVLGWESCEFDAERPLGALSKALETAMARGDVDRQPVKPLAHLLLAALTEASLYIARADDGPAARNEMGVTLLRLLDGLRRRPGAEVEARPFEEGVEAAPASR